ncbi:MAG: NADH-quinone oxidoreductase subunit A [Anaerolineaceae bacterium]|nr:MAG: NADH-quinone oxidoreductase subunit A [Anaerolineaceae bacterium]
MALQQFAPIAALIILAVVLTFIISNISTIFGPSNNTSRKTAPYESGMQPIGVGMRRMPVKFYLIGVLFILFDIEVIFFLPWAVVFRDLGFYGLAVMGLFFFILTIGLIYEWKKGALEWE